MIEQAIIRYTEIMERIKALYAQLSTNTEANGDNLISLLTLEINLQGILLKLEETRLQAYLQSQEVGESINPAE